MLGVYLSSFVYGYGMFVVVAAAQQNEVSKDIDLEAYYFAVGGTKAYGNTSFTHYYLIGDENNPNISIDKLYQQILFEAKHLIISLQNSRFLQTGDAEFLKREPEFSEHDKAGLTTVRDKGYQKELKDMTDKSACVELKDYMKLILQ